MGDLLLLIILVVWAALALLGGGGTKDWYEWGMTPGRVWNEGEKL